MAVCFTDLKLRRLLLLPAAFALVACADATPVATGAAPQATAGAAPTTAAAPPALELSALELISGEAPQSWLVLGLVVNRSASAVGQLRVRVELLDSDRDPIAEQMVAPLVSGLAAGEAAPFAAWFSSVGAVASARAAPSSRPAPSAARPDLTIELGERFITPTGELAILGVVTNNETQPAQLTELALLAVDPQGRPRALAEMRSGPGQLAAGERVPFLAIADRSPGHVHWRPFQDSTFAEQQQAAVIEPVGSPELRFTPQGAPFVIGEIQNSSAAAQSVRLLFVFWQGSRLLAVGELDTPIPLEAGARLGYTAGDFAGFRLRSEALDRDEIQLELRLEAAPSAATTRPLAVSVEVFHSVGSALFVRGSVTNPHPSSLAAPAVLAEIRLLSGELWTAGWSVLGDSLAAGEVQEFVLELPLDQALDLTEVELDLRAFGTRAGE